MPTFDEPGEREIALALSPLGGVALVQHLLHAFPQFPADERLVDAAIGLALPVEVSGVESVAQDVVDGGRIHWLEATAESQPRGAGHPHDISERVPTR